MANWNCPDLGSSFTFSFFKKGYNNPIIEGIGIMNEKKHYFVTIDKEDIQEISIPDNGIEYEIYATHEEMKEVEMLFIEKRKNAKDAAKFLKKPFDEWGAHDERNEYETNLIKIYQKVYDLGTASTKEKIEKIGLLK